MLRELSPESLLTRWSLESRRDELRVELEAAKTAEHPLASAALFFGGEPVVGNQGIESSFGSHIINRFQAIVSQVSALQSRQSLAQRGRTPGKEQSKLYVTRVVHGSFGFQFNELERPGLPDSTLKETVEETSRLIAAFDDADDAAFGVTVQKIDNRLLNTIRGFFDYIYNQKATFRIVSGDFEKTYNTLHLERAIERAKVTTIQEDERIYSGQLVGILPGSREYEYLTENEGSLRGKLAASLADDEIAALIPDWYRKSSQAVVQIKRILRQDAVSHETFTLTRIEARSE